MMPSAAKPTEPTTARVAPEPGQRPPKPRRGEVLELRVESIAQGGAGVARKDGFVIFVEGGYPGDVVRAEVTKAKRDFAHARTVDLVEPSPDRVPIRCDHEGGECPGSPWQAMRYDRQLEHKQELLGDALRRLGRLEGFELGPFIPADAIWRYRNKLEYSFGTRPDGSLVLGFHPRGRWDTVLDARDCMLASERSNAVRNHVRDWCRTEGLGVYDRRHGNGFLRNLVVREGTRTGALQLRLVTSEGGFREEAFIDSVRSCFPDAGILWSRTPGVAEVSQGRTTSVLAGSETLDELLLDLRFRISPEAFFQTNTKMAEHLYSLAADYAALQGSERVYDLYCGIGTLSLVLSLRAGELWAVDVVEAAIADAIENAQLNEIDNAHFFAGDLRDAIRPLAERAPRPHVVVVDPPRAGLSQKIVRRLLELHPSRIVYVSCNPTTLAPNARQMVDAGYRLVKVRGVDMFPHTPHLECVALLERARG
jgi:23S rRNA (uracil1939-C5)-methyltransferase